MAEFKEKILKSLRQVRHSLAAAMEKSQVWDLKDTVLSLSFNSPFESTFIEKESREIEKIIKDSLSWEISIKTIVKKKESESINQKPDEQVELVRSVFRGTVINRS